MLFRPKKPDVDYGKLWQSYSRWRQEDEFDYGQAVEQKRAELGAKGVKEGSPAWDAAMQSVEDIRQERMAGVQGSKTYQMLQSHFEKAKGAYEHLQGSSFLGQDSAMGESMRMMQRAYSRPMGRAERFARERYDTENPNQPRREDFDTFEEFQEARRAMPKFEVTMEDYYTANYGQADISGYQGSQPVQQVDPAAQAAQQRARSYGGGRAPGTLPIFGQEEEGPWM